MEEDPREVYRSPPARGAWIATPVRDLSVDRINVASREGGVDRNGYAERTVKQRIVASREGGVDRNVLLRFEAHSGGVASREGGVDRNIMDG